MPENVAKEDWNEKKTCPENAQLHWLVGNLIIEVRKNS